MLDNITAPAIIRNGRMDLLAANHLGRAMHASVYDSEPGDPPNFARYTFLDDDAQRFYPDWDIAADTCVAILRTEAGRDPHDKALHDLVGELSTRSEEFRRRWARHDVRLHGAGTKHFHHTVVGDLELAYESVDMVSEPGLTLTVYAAEPGLAHRSTPSTCSPPGPARAQSPTRGRRAKAGVAHTHQRGPDSIFLSGR